MRTKIGLSALVFLIVASSCGDQPAADTQATAPVDTMPATEVVINADVKEDSVTYKDGSTTLKGYIAYNANDTGKRPAILVIPEWWGLNDYIRGRAKQLAALGYVAMAVDMYGDGKTAADPQQAMSFAGPFYQNSEMLKSRFGAAYKKLKGFKGSDSSKISAIGYCFGGYIALNAAKMGANLLDVVSFHGGLGGVAPSKDSLKANILICHGAADNMVPALEVAQFKKSMDSIGHAYTFKTYADATHAFTNPEATAKGKQFGMPIVYNGAADTASWNDMRAFFATTGNK